MSAHTRAPRLNAQLRETEKVTPLELFFDLVFVLCITQCTALMARDPTWEGLAKGLLVLGVLWWAWCGYAWLTSVVDPEEGAVRFAMFGAMAHRPSCRPPSQNAAAAIRPTLSVVLPTRPVISDRRSSGSSRLAI